ncbi:unnamed protein product [Candidula unifasciata]|uniref:GCS light chain n=1 Tax=Candidula unifasciata TaxID=100452 RepID=A0A8S3Z9P0_9EUPU|nr:unnamed protein product [Candidula unifasciata]
MEDEDLFDDTFASELPLSSVGGKSQDNTTKFSKVNLSALESLTLPRCTGCQRQFPFPVNLPENHAVISLEESQAVDRTRMAPPPQGTRSGTVKSWNGSVFAAGVKSTRSGQVGSTASNKSNLSVNNHSSSTMTDDIPMFPKAKSMFLHSGNIINWNRLKRKPNQTSTEEVCDCIGNTLASYLETQDKTELQYVTEIYKVNSENVQKIDDTEREEVKITVKVFVCLPLPTSVISETVNKVLNELGTSYIETLLLAVSPGEGEEDDSSAPSVSVIKPYWEAMEELVAAETVLSLGVCDLTKDSLEDLYNWAKVKPSVDQVNLESCCVMPQDLTAYAKAVNVQLLTHNDRPVFIPEETLQETIRSVSTEADGRNWVPQWVVRYSGIVKCRGIIKMKGYIIHARRDHKIILP